MRYFLLLATLLFCLTGCVVRAVRDEYIPVYDRYGNFIRYERTYPYDRYDYYHSDIYFYWGPRYPYHYPPSHFYPHRR